MYGHLLTELAKIEMAAIDRIFHRDECGENVAVVVRLTAMEAVISNPHQGVENAANLSRGAAGAAIAQKRHEPGQADIARHAVGIGGLLETLEGSEYEPRLMGFEGL